MPIKHAKGVKLLIKVGDGASPEVFAVTCSINAERGITLSAGTTDTDIPNCEAPEDIAWVLREKINLSAAITGSGLLDTEDVPMFAAWLISPNSKNVKVIVDVPGADGGTVFTGKFHLTEFPITGDRGGKMQTSISLVSDGAVTVTANAG